MRRVWGALAIITVASAALWLSATIRPAARPTVVWPAVMVTDSAYTQDLLCASLCRGQRSSSTSPDGSDSAASCAS